MGLEAADKGGIYGGRDGLGGTAQGVAEPDTGVDAVSEPAMSERKERHLTGGPGASMGGDTRRGHAELGRAPCWAAAVRHERKWGGAGLRPEREGKEWPTGARPARRKWATGAEAGQPGRKEGEFGFSFSYFFPKQIQNANSNQFRIRLQIKQYKMICSGMNAHT